MQGFGRQFPSVEKLLRLVLEPRTGVHVATELPPEFDDDTSPLHELPLIQVDRISGADLDPVLDRPMVDVDCFAHDRGTAQDLAEAVRYALRVELPGSVVDGVVFTRTRTITGPRLVAHPNRNVRRYVATYELFLHPQG